jgi:hypothetical protein
MALQLAESVKRNNAKYGTREWFRLITTPADGAMYGCTWGPPYSGTGDGTVWPHLRKVFAVDAAHGKLPCSTTMTVFSLWGYTCNDNLVLIFYGCFLDNENKDTWEMFMRDCYTHQPGIAKATFVADGDKGFGAALDAVFEDGGGPKRFFCALHLQKNVHRHLGKVAKQHYVACTKAANFTTLRPLLVELKADVKKANEGRDVPYTGLDKQEAELYPAATFAPDGFGPPQTFGYTTSQGVESANSMMKNVRQMYPITGLLGLMRHELARHIKLHKQAMDMSKKDASDVLPKHMRTIKEMALKIVEESNMRVREGAIDVDRLQIYHVESASDPTVVYKSKLSGTCTCGSGFQHKPKFSTGNCKHEIAVMLKLGLQMCEVVPSWRTVAEHVKFYETMCLRSPADDLASIEVDASSIKWPEFTAPQRGRKRASKRKKGMVEQFHDIAVAKRVRASVRVARASVRVAHAEAK